MDVIKRITLQDQSGKAQTLEVHIPAGIDSGKSIRLRGKGMPGTGKGGAGGDLLLESNCSAGKPDMNEKVWMFIQRSAFLIQLLCLVEKQGCIPCMVM